MGRLAGKVAIVAGAGSIAEGWSNGKATSVLFAREGAKVFRPGIASPSFTMSQHSTEQSRIEPPS